MGLTNANNGNPPYDIVASKESKIDWSDLAQFFAILFAQVDWVVGRTRGFVDRLLAQWRPGQSALPWNR
jgi:hypothetical protein